MIALLSSLCLAYSGFTALCLSMQRHHRDLFGRASSRRIALLLKLAGWPLLVISVVPALSHGATIGVVIWFGLLSIAALLVVWIFAWRPRLAAMLALALVILPLATFLIGVTSMEQLAGTE
ncbi:MAG: DUF3325 domain-containing protein [Sphingobium sp.]